MASMTLRASDYPRFDAVLATLEDRARDTAPLMDRIGQAMESSTIERFNEERAPDGSRWTPSLRARIEGGKTLTKSAGLKGSITHRSSARDVEWGTNKIYGPIHQFGGTIHAKGGGRLKFRLPGGLGWRNLEKVTMPKRPFVGVSSDDELEIIAQAEDYLAAVLP